MVKAIPGQLCAALSADRNYYRGQIKDVTTDGKVIIHYIDYGNAEPVPLANLKELDASHRQQSAFAIRAYLPIECEDKIDAVQMREEIVKMTDQYQLCTNIIECYQNHWTVEITNGGVSLSGRLCDLNFVRKLTLPDVRSRIDADQRQKAAQFAAKVAPEPQVVKQVEPVKEVEPAEQVEPAVVVPVPAAVETVAEAQPVATEEAAPSAESTSVVAPKPSGIAAYISHADQPDRFYLQLESITDDLEHFRENLQIVAPQLPELNDYRAGAMCVAKYSVDEYWYRARIIDTDGEITSIQFIDYGNTDTITDKALLKAYDTNYDAVPPYALPCALALEPRDTTEWTDAACEVILELLPHTVTIEYISEGPLRSYVRLFHGERNIAKELIAAQLANPIEIIKSGEKCYVSHVNAIDDFYIQMEASSNGLDLLEQYLTEASRFEPLKEVKTGIMCIALYDDGCYYRARALADRTDATQTVEVAFVDFGNTYVTNDVRSLPQNIAELPHSAKNCALHEPKTIQSWSEEALVKFHELTDVGRTVFTVRLVVPTNRIASIELWIDDRNIGDELATLCAAKPDIESMLEDSDATIVNQSETTLIATTVEPPVEVPNTPKSPPMAERIEAFVVHVDSPHSFYVQLNSKTAEVNEMVQLMLGDFQPIAIDLVNTDEVYAALFEDCAYYRCRIIEKHTDNCRVHFIDFGNSADSADIRIIPDELKAMPPLVIHCQLGADAKSWNQDQLQTFLDFATIETTFQIEVDDATSTPQTVQLFQADVNVLETIAHAPITTPMQPINNQSTPDAPRKNLTFETTTSEIASNDVVNHHTIAAETVDHMMNDALQRMQKVGIVDGALDETVNSVFDSTLVECNQTV